MGDFVKVAEAADLPPGASVTIQGIDIVDVMVANCGGTCYAISAVCTHKGAPLNKGTVNGEYITCPWHKASFRIADGKNNWPADRPLRSFKVKVEGGSVYVSKQSGADR
jgi:nitrite reductase/ring-hydroxylating ferredoxin subunit